MPFSLAHSLALVQPVAQVFDRVHIFHIIGSDVGDDQVFAAEHRWHVSMTSFFFSPTGKGECAPTTFSPSSLKELFRGG